SLKDDVMKTFTEIHVGVSLIGIFSGLVVLFGLLASKRLDRWTALFLLTTVATSVTGFFFPFHGFTRRSGSASSRSWCWPLRSSRVTRVASREPGAGSTW